MTRAPRIGITGGIGSGKSYVARLLQATYRLRLYDCDSRAKQLMTTSADIRRRLQELVGSDAYLPDGQLNRTLLAEYLFRSADNARRINAIVHPAVRQDWLHFASEEGTPALLESAILVEAGFADTVDRLIVVVAPEAMRIERTMQRDGATEEQVRARMRAQASEEALLAEADVVVHNDGRPLLPQLQDFPELTY